MPGGAYVPTTVWHEYVEIVETQSGSLFLIAIENGTTQLKTAKSPLTPDESTPTVLKWNAECYRFDAYAAGSASAGCQTVEELYEEASFRQVTMGIYGVVPLGRHCTLIYITERSPCGSLPFGHTVHEIKGLGTKVLPTIAGNASKSPVPTGSAPFENNASMAGARATPSMNALPALAPHVLKEYTNLLEFFSGDGEKVGGLHFYTSFSTDVSEAISRHQGWGDRAITPQQLHGSGTPPSMGPRSSSTHSFPGNDPAHRLYQWNYNLTQVHGTFDGPTQCFTPPVIRGAFSSFSHTLKPEEEGNTESVRFNYALFTRMSFRNAGTRYNKRGLDSSGCAANTAETEVLVWSKEKLSTFMIIRGSVPVLWTQPADLTFKPASCIDKESSYETLKEHISLLEPAYDCNAIHCVDLLSASNKKVEAPLSQYYGEMVAALDLANPQDGSMCSIPKHRCRVTYKHIDLSKWMKKAKSFDECQERILGVIGNDLEDCGFSLWHAGADGQHQHQQQQQDSSPYPCPSVTSTVKRQTGIFRVNCLDCLDRTNAAQFIASEHILAKQLVAVCGEQALPTKEAVKRLILVLHDRVGSAWVKQGNNVSHCYTGYNALITEFVGKRSLRSLATKARDGQTATKRFLQQNFSDGKKQDAISVFTGTHDPVPLARMKNCNPFERHMTTMNLLVVASLVVGLIMWTGNAVMWLQSDANRLDSIVMQILWSMFVGLVVYLLRKDAPSYTNYPLLC